MSNNIRIAIIGAGPAGLYFASLCQAHNIDYTIFEASDTHGGQLTHLYPEKDIVNIQGFESIKAKDYINYLVSLIDIKKIKYNIKVTDIELENIQKQYDFVIIAVGLGNYRPRPLGLLNEEKYNVIYNLTDYSFLTGKNIVIFGGGDSALDWAKQLSTVGNVTLVHRRDEFRGNADTIKNCKIIVYLSYVPDEITDKYIQIKSVKDDSITKLPYDYILVNFGLQVDKPNYTNNNLIKIGDFASDTHTIEAGKQQANKIFNKILKGESLYV